MKKIILNLVLIISLVSLSSIVLCTGKISSLDLKDESLIPPDSITATPADQRVTLSWNSDTTLQKTYTIYWQNSPGVQKASSKIVGTTSPYLHEGLQNDTTYYYKITTNFSGKEGWLSTEVQARPYHDPNVPFAPKHASATPGDQIVSVTCSTVTNATSYTIYWSNMSGITLKDSAIRNQSLPYIHTGLSNKTIYYYRLTAVNSYGESYLSNEVNAMPDNYLGPPDPILITAGDQSITLTWDAVPHALSYQVFWALHSNVTKSDSTIPLFQSPCLHEPLVNGSTYYYRVRAVNAISESAFSIEVSATPVDTTTVPETPADLSTIAGSQQINVSWSAVVNVVNYNIYWDTITGVTTVSNKLTFDSTKTDFIHTSLTNGITYYYKVSAQNLVGESSLSNEVSETPSGNITVPQNLRIAWEGGATSDEKEIYFFNGQSTVKLTDNSFYDLKAKVSGNNVIWIGNYYDLYYYNGTEIKQITTHHRTKARVGLHRISGNKIVWEDLVSSVWQVFYWNGSTTEQLTNTAEWARDIDIDGDNIVWHHVNDNDGSDIFFRSGTNAMIQLTQNTYAYRPVISGNNIVWLQREGNEIDLILYDGVTTKNLTENDNDTRLFQRISGDNIVWIENTGNGTDYEIHYYNGSTINTLTDNTMMEWEPQISGSNIVWYTNDEENSEIFFYNGSSVIQVTDNSYADMYPRICSKYIVWQGKKDGEDYEILFWDGINTYQLTNNSFNDELPYISKVD